MAQHAASRTPARHACHSRRSFRSTGPPRTTATAAQQDTACPQDRSHKNTKRPATLALEDSQTGPQPHGEQGFLPDPRRRVQRPPSQKRNRVFFWLKPSPPGTTTAEGKTPGALRVARWPAGLRHHPAAAPRIRLHLPRAATASDIRRTAAPGCGSPGCHPPPCSPRTAATASVIRRTASREHTAASLTPEVCPPLPQLPHATRPPAPSARIHPAQRSPGTPAPCKNTPSCNHARLQKHRILKMSTIAKTSCFAKVIQHSYVSKIVCFEKI